MYSQTQIKRFIARIKDDEDLIRQQIELLKTKDIQLTNAGIAINTRIDNLQAQVTAKLTALENRITALENPIS